MPGIAIRDVRIEVDGLTYEPESRRLHGTPVAAGDFKISIRYGIEGQAGHVASEATLIVIPDPRTLWKNLPTDPNDPYWKSDEDCLHIEGSDDFTLIGGSKRGRSHAQKGTFRDDDFFIYSQASTGWQIAVVSDGAGSAKYSRRGSSIICKEGGEYLEKLLAGEDGEKLVTLIEAWHACTASGDECQSEYHHLRNGLFTTIGYAAYHATKMIESECKHRSDLGGTFKDYSSTALLGIVKRFPFGVFCAGFWVGDGAIGAVLDDGTPLLLGVPDGGEYSGQTRFLSPETVTQDELQKRLRFALLQNFKGLYLMSDGVSDPYFQTDAGLEMPDRWAKLVDDVEAAARFADRDPGTADRLVTWLDFWSKGEHDDRTLVIIY